LTRHVLVTGGGTGIGKATAARFAKLSDRVWITGRRAAPLTETAAALGVTPVVCDATDPDQLTRLRDELPNRLDVLVNNAGGNTDLVRPEPTDLRSLAASWLANLEANVLSAVLTTEAVKDRLADGASVISIGSIGAERGAGSYGPAKAALASWNIALSAELGPRGVTANVVSPGYVADTEFFRDTLTGERRAALIAATHTGRAGTPAEIAGVIAFLASPDARHITAQLIPVNGGAWPTR
jgi:3-oxoacyl-[acyl-carrier protein] reductase